MGGAFDYYKDELDEASPFGYYAGRPKEDRFNAKGQKIVFNEVHGEFGLELGLRFGMSEEEFREIEAGHFNLQSIDAQGNPIYEYQTRSHKTAWIDVTYAPPKWVSEYFARAETDAEARAIALAIKEAALETHKECVEDSARVAKVNTGKVEGLPEGASKAKLYGQTRVTAKMIYIPVMGFTNRDGQPQVHVHMPTASMCKVGDKVLTADEYDIKATAGYRMDVFSGKVAAKMQALGYGVKFSDFDTSRNGRQVYEGADSSRSLRRHWSTERDDIARRDYAAKFGYAPNAVQLEKWMRASRPPKTDKEQDQNPDRARWINEANEEAQKVIAQLATANAKAKAAKYWNTAPVARRGPITQEPLERRLALLKSRLMGEKGLCERSPIFTGKMIRPAIAKLSRDLALTKEQRFEFEAELRKELVVFRSNENDAFAYFTTERIIEEEAAIAEDLDARENTHQAIPEHFIELAMRSNPGKTPDESQREATRAACGKSGIVFIESPAGGGKTTTAQYIVTAHAISGEAEQFFFTSPGAKLPEDMAAGIRGVTHWGSLKSLEAQIAKGTFDPNKKAVIFIDEAATVNTFAMRRLLKMAPKAKIICMGDMKQGLPIGAGGWYFAATQKHQVETLEKVWRHKDADDLRDFTLMRQGKSAESLGNMVARNRVHVGTDVKDKHALIIEHFKFHLIAGKTQEQLRIIVDGENHEIDRLNAEVQEVLRSYNEIQGVGYEVHEQQQGRRYSIHQGDEIVFREPYSEKTRSLGRTKYVTIRNGTTAKVLKLDTVSGEAKIMTKDKRLATIHVDERIAPAYAQSTAKFQGNEIDVAMVVPGRMTTANSLYSAETRAVEAAHIFLDYETFGERPGLTLADQTQESVIEYSAHWHMANKDSFINGRMGKAAKDLVTFIDGRYEYSLAESIIGSPAFEALVVRADKMAERGLDANRIIADAIEVRELSTAEDTAKVILWRLDNLEHRQHERVEDWEQVKEESDYAYDETLLDPALVARLRLSDLNQDAQRDFTKQRREQDQGMGRTL